jgi:hypothetical protein
LRIDLIEMPEDVDRGCPNAAGGTQHGHILDREAIVQDGSVVHPINWRRIVVSWRGFAAGHHNRGIEETGI